MRKFSRWGGPIALSIALAATAACAATPVPMSTLEETIDAWCPPAARQRCEWPASQSSSPLERAVDAYVEPLVETNNFYGVVLIAQGDEVLVGKGFGLASIELGAPHTPESVFHIASVSKPFTATAILLLAERGLIDLEAPLSDLLPDYPNADRLTIRDLLLHTSGIPDINVQPVYQELSLHRQTPADLVDAFKDLPLAFEPGSRFSYSNSNYNLLALIIERTSGMSYGEFLDREFFTPLALSHTGHPGEAQDVIPHMVDGYLPVDRIGLARAPWLDWTAKTGNGSLYSTASELHTWVRAFFGGELLTSETMETALADQLTDVEVGGLVNNLGYVWGSVEHLGRRRHHFIGRSPGFSATLLYYPSDELTIIVLSNTYSLASVPAANAFAAMVFNEPYEAPSLSAEPPPSETIARVVGDYQFGADAPVPNMTLSIVAREGHLFVETDFPGIPPSALLPESDLRFLMRSYWLPLTFVAEPDEDATAFDLFGARATRVDR